MWLLLIFITVPALEAYLFWKVGSRIGVLETMGVIVLTGMLGWMLVKSQGLATLARIRKEMGDGGLPAVEMVSGLILIGAGLLLITPGFLTDTVGFLILIPPLRRGVARLLMRRFKLRIFGSEGLPGGFAAGAGAPSEGRRPPDGEVIDVDASEVPTSERDRQDPRSA